MEIKIDARGLSCPQPVLLTMEALKKQAESYAITVDNQTALGNVTRCLKKAGKTVETEANGEDTVIRAR